MLEIAAAVRPEWSVARVAIESCCGAADLPESLIGAIANRWMRGLYHQMKEMPMAA